jgi:hypothetical protein
MTFLFFLLTVNANLEETFLRQTLFSSYNPKVRPISESIPVEIGLAVQNIESFDQMQESIVLNIWVRETWYDPRLEWDSSLSNLTFLSVDIDEVWTPDIELLNAAALPEVYTLKGGLSLYSSGLVFYSNPAVFKTACSLKLELFPFDTQVCSMKFASWVYSNRYLNLTAYADKSKQIDILPSFSHSEWQIGSFSLTETLEYRDCCPGDPFNELNYEITLDRYPHYYKLSMGMTIALVLVSFIIMLIEPANVSRTSTAVFIPLTILALQLTLADKIPVVGYYTLMDNFFLCCFITSMLVAIESGIIYSLIMTESSAIINFSSRNFDIKKLMDKDKEQRDNNASRKNKHIEEIRRLKMMDIDDNDHVNQEFNDVIQVVEGTAEGAASESSVDNAEVESVMSLPIDNDVVKTIPHDARILKFTYKERLIYNEMVKYIKFADNIFRILLPVIYLSYVGSLMAQE